MKKLFKNEIYGSVTVLNVPFTENLSKVTATVYKLSA